jgi:hypothetical protein
MDGAELLRKYYRYPINFLMKVKIALSESSPLLGDLVLE